MSALSEAKDMFSGFTSETRNVVAAMTATLNRKSRTAAARAVSNRKSGMIDPAKLAGYRTRDDIFATKQVLPKGKGHKVVILIDWSASMTGIIRPVIMQAITIARFCKRAGVAFSVMAFTDRDVGALMDDETAGIIRRDTRRRLENDAIMDFRLMEFLNDRMSAVQIETAAFNLFCLSSSVFRETGGRRASSPFSMASTPLTHSLIGLRDIAMGERQKYESYNVIVLSDGDSNELYWRGHSGYNGDPTTIVDAVTGRAYRPDDKTIAHHNGSRARIETDMVLGWLKSIGVKTFFYHFDGLYSIADQASRYRLTPVMSGDLSKHAYCGKWFLNATQCWLVNPSALFSGTAVIRKIERSWDKLDEDEEDEITDDEWEITDEDRHFAELDESVRVQKLVEGRRMETLRQLIGANLVDEICKEIRYL